MSLDTVKVRFHPVDNTDWISYWCWKLGTMRGLDMRFVHVSLEFHDQVIELTWEGVGWCRVKDDCRQDSKTITIWFPNSDIDGIYQRISTLMSVDYKLSLWNLLMLLMRKRCTGITCSSFVETVLGLQPTSHTPTDLFNSLSQYDGYLCRICYATLHAHCVVQEII